MVQPTATELPGHLRIAGTLSEVEREAYATATAYSKRGCLSQPPERAYLDVLPAARQQILSRLVGGLLRDRPECLPDPILIDPERRLISDGSAVEATQTDLASVVADISVPEAADRIGVIPFPSSDAHVVAPIEATVGFARHTFLPPFRKRTSSTAQVLTHPDELLELLEREGVFPDKAHAERFTREIHQSSANLALAQLAKEWFRCRLSTDAPDLFDPRSEPDASAADRCALFERFVTDGHPFHPGAKIRDGMSPTDSLLYAPEFTASIDIRFVAVRSDTALQATAGDHEPLTERLIAHLPDLEIHLADALPARTAVDDYVVLPIHPWQYINTIAPRFASQYESDVVVPIPEYTLSATPLLSFRTVVPYPEETTRGHPHHIKLSTDVRLTNTIRTLAPDAVYNGPRISSVLRAIEADESFERFGILSEQAAACYYPHSKLQAECSDLAEQLSALVRQNPYEHRLVDGDAQPLAVASLLANSPTTDRPLICDAIDAFARQSEATTPGDAAERFFDAYCRAVIPGPLTFLCKYGIALESHPQNTCLVIEDGLPVASLARDLAGIRVNAERLSTTGYAVDTYPESMIITSDTDPLYNKLYYALFQNHLTELIVLLTEHTGLDERTCWERVRATCREVFSSLRADGTIPEDWINQDEDALFAEQMPHKALTAMRLHGETYDYIMRPVPNPLSN